MLMLMLPSRLFLSETDAFLRDYLNTHPETVDQQKEGMQLWWGRAPDIRGQESNAKDRESDTC